MVTHYPLPHHYLTHIITKRKSKCMEIISYRNKWTTTQFHLKNYCFFMNFSNMVLGSIYCVTQNETHAYIQSYVNFFSFFFIVNQHTFITELHYLVGIHVFFLVYLFAHQRQSIHVYEYWSRNKMQDSQGLYMEFNSFIIVKIG